MRTRVFTDLLFAILLLPFIAFSALAAVSETDTVKGMPSFTVEFKSGLFSVQAKEAPLGEVLAEIEKRSGFVISIDEELKTRPITLSFPGQNITRTMEAITNAAGLAGYGISYKSGNTPGKIGQWVIDKIALADKGGESTTQQKIIPPDNQRVEKKTIKASAATKKSKIIEKEPFFDKRLNRYVEVAKGEVFVRFPKGVTKEQIEKFHKEKGTQAIKDYEKVNAARLKIPATESVSEFIEKYSIDGKQAYIEPVFLTSQQAVHVNDPSFMYQWAIPQIQADKAWDVNNGSPDVIIAVIDTGIDIVHPDLKNKVVQGIDIVNGGSGGIDDNGHGTHVAGIIAAESNNSIGIAGISWKSKLMPIKVLTTTGEGTYSDLIEGIIYAVDHGAKVLNLSLGGYSYSQSLADAVEYAHSSRAVIVAAGGNENTSEPLYPAAYPNVIGVSATDPSDLRWSASNYGGYIKLSAPGVGVLSTQKDNGYGAETGSSAATAHVSGVAALVLSKNPDFSNTQVENILYQTADDLGDKGWDNYYGFGRVNALKAIEKAAIEVHDVAVTGIRIEPETFKVGEATKIIVTVENQGTFVEEDIHLSVNISVDGKLTAIERIIPIIKTNEKLDISFDWIAEANKEVVIVAEVIALADGDLSDNKLDRKLQLIEADGIVKVKFEVKTHRWITNTAVKFLESRVDISIYTELNTYINKLMDGAEHEDCAGYNLPPKLLDLGYLGEIIDNPAYSPLCANNRIDAVLRYMRHFYRPVDHLGYYDNAITGVRYENSYAWGSSSDINSYDWQDSILKYKTGSKDEAYFSLGHVLHLIEDASLPEHTQLEAHGELDIGINQYVFNVINQKGYEKFVADNTWSDTSASALLPRADINEGIKIYENLYSYFFEMAKLSYYRNRFEGVLSPTPTDGSPVGGKLSMMFPSLRYRSGWSEDGWIITDERVNTGLLADNIIWDPPYDLTDDWWEIKQFDNNTQERDGFYYIEKSNYVKPIRDKINWEQTVENSSDEDLKEGTADEYSFSDLTDGKTLAERMAADLIPLAIRYVAGATMLFWNETHLGEGENIDFDPNFKKKFTDAYSNYGGATKIGYPINFVHKWGNYWVQDFRPMKDGNGNEIGGFGSSIIIYNPDTYKVYTVHGDIWKQVYESMGGPDSWSGPESWLGPPIGDETTHATYGTIQYFKNGYITHKDDGGNWWEAYKDTTPPTVSITKPSNGDIISGTIPVEASANDDLGISKVEFYIGSSILFTDWTSPYAYSWDTTTIPNDVYAIKAIAYDKIGQPSQVHTITVTVSIPTSSGGNNAPNKPTAYQYKSDGVTGMAAGDTTNERTVVMKGNVIDPDNDAVSLEVEVKHVGTNSNFAGSPSTNCVSSGFVSSGGTAVVTCSGLADGRYKWQARTKDSEGAYSTQWTDAGYSGDVADFIVSAGATAINKPPTVTVISPNGGGGETLTVGSSYDIKWNVSDSTSTILKIEIYASQDGGVTWSSSPIHSNTSNTGLFTWMPSATTTQGRIKVVATDSYGVAGSDLSDGNFSVVSSCTKPSVPEFYSIGLLSESGSYTVSWSNVYGAGNYTLQEATNSSFTSPIEYSSIAQPSKSISGKTTNTYYYRVRADNSCGSSDWSNIVYIPVVINQPPNVPSNPSLVDGTTNVSRQPTLSWSGGDTDGTVEYAVKFGTEPNPGFYAGFGSISGTSYQIPYILEPGTTYYWGIKSRDSKGLETEGPIWRFTTAYSYADLVPTNLTVTGDIAPNVHVNLDLTVKNQGTYTAPGAQVFFYLSSTSGGKEQKLNNGTSIPQLAPGQETTISQTVTLSNLKAGQSYIDAWIDTQNYFTEGNLSNNTLSYVINYLDSNAPGISSLWFAWSLLKVRTGHEYSIAWNVADDIGVTKMDFYYSTDNGTNWKTIATGFVPESSWSNSYSWTIPSDAPLTDQFKIKMVAWDGSGNSGEATAGPYTVISGVAPTVTLFSPNGGEVWDLGSTQTIKWSADAPNGIGNMVLYLYYGDKVEYIANITSNTSGVYSWTLPSSAHYESNNAKVKISVEDQNGNASYDFSDGYFTISDPSAPPPAPWNTPLTISSGECSGESNIASDSTGNIHLVCQGASSILYRKFDGTAWVSMPAVYNFDASAYSVEQIGLSIDSNGYPHVVWTRGVTSSGGSITNLNQRDIFYSDFNGTAWSSPLNLSDNIPGATSLTSLAWSTRTAMPLGKSSAASAVVNGKIYVFGGTQTVTNYAYDTGTDSWSQIADSPFGADDGRAAVINNKVYVFGSIGSYNGLKVYDPISNSWTVLTSSPNAGRLAGVTAVNGKLYVIGGADGNLTPFNTVQEYDPSANSWAVKVGMPTARYGAGTVSFNNLIYVFGGRGSGGAGSRQVEVYDPATDTWTSKVQMSPGVESYSAVAVVNSKIYLLGGFESPNYSNVVYEYDPSTDWWLTKTSMPTARFLSSYGAVGNAIYVIGGNGGGQDLSVNEQVTVTSAGSATVSQDPSVAVDAANNTHIAWGDGYSFNSDYSISGQANVYYRKKDSAGNWSGVTQLTIGGGSAPEIVLDHNGRLHMSYGFYSISSSIGHMMWDGLSWSSPVTVSTAYSGLMDISVDNGNRPHLVWWYYDAIAGEQQIFYSGHDGAGWSIAEKISSSAPGNPFEPSIGIDSDGRSHVIYEDSQGRDLLYRFKGTTGWSSPVQLNMDSQYVSDYSGDFAITPNNWAYTIWMASSGGSTALFYNFANISGISSDSTPPSVSVTSPSGGETISNGALYEILWSALDNGTISSVSIEYSSDGGTTYNLIASNEPNDGAYQWTVPNINSSNVIVRVSAVDYGGNQGIGYSGLFSISDKTTPAVTVLAPNGGEALTPGGVQMITWTATDNSGVSYVDIFYSNDGGSSWSSIASAQPNTGSFAWTVPYDISSNCRVKVVAYDTAGLMGEDASDAAFAVAYANAPPVAPFSPSPLDGETNVQLGAVLGWSGVDPDADALTYSVYFGTAVDPAIVATGLLVPVYTPGSLTPNTTYYWKADATDGYSTTVGTIWSFTTGAEAISAPTALGATVQSASQVSLVWMDSASNETQYSVERKSGVDGAYAEIAVLPADAISYVDSGLKGNTVYIYRIRASGGTAVSAYSNEAAATTANNLPNTPSSPVPANGVNGQSAAQILSWNGGDPDYSDTVTYDVYFGTSSNPPLISSGQSEAYFSPGILSLGSVYYWRVVATDSHGGVAESPVWYFVLDTFDTTPPADGTLSTTALNTVVDLSWFGFSDSGSGISGYKLVYDTTGTPASCAGTPLYAGADTSYSHTKLTNGISYGYRVCAIDNAGNTSSGITATGTPVAPDRLSMPLDDSGILGVERDDGGSDSNNIDSATSNPRLDIAFNFGITLRDPSGNAPQYVRLYITNRSNPGTTDYYPVDLTCDTNWAYGAYCSYPTLLGPAANHKYYFEAKLADGTVLRYPATGEIAGPTVELLNGQNMVGVPRDLATADLDGSAAFGNAQTYKWVSEGITTDGNKGSYVLVDSSNPVKPGDGYFTVRNGGSATLPELELFNDVLDSTYSVTMKPGWNMISNPYGGNIKLDAVQVQKGSDAPVSWLDAATNGWVVNAIYFYKGSDWGSAYAFESAGGSPDATLVPWMGYWVYLNKNDVGYSLVIPRP